MDAVLTFVLIMAAPSDTRLRASPRSRHPHTKGTLKLCLLMWWAIIRWSQHLQQLSYIQKKHAVHLAFAVHLNLHISSRSIANGLVA